ncbi:MAG TPA: orotidine-5'-phosphate decarboxylase [Gemmatimonadaceae bacterium]|nr:orotidine-5'-phosphate decarboxylase [Gemmatimonadaceae bacterium]
MSVTPIVALDVKSLGAALSLVERLDQTARYYKVGSELFTRAGPEIVSTIRARQCDVFLDLKFHDIPNTVASAVAAAADMGVAMTTVHASGGMAMLRSAVEAASPQCRIVAVSVLTSLDATAVAASWGRSSKVDVQEEVLRLARLAVDAGVGGFVCSGHEAAAVRKELGGQLVLVVPGIRFSEGASHDQARVVTPADAVRAGADYVVVGRAVTAAPDPVEAMKRLSAEIKSALKE